MSYNCQICNSHAEGKKLVHRVKNDEGRVMREVTLCPKCHSILQGLLGRPEQCRTVNVSELIARDIIASFETRGSFP